MKKEDFNIKKKILVTVQPSIQVTNQLVAAPVGSDVILQCYVEASPKALNSWYKEKGNKFFFNIIILLICTSFLLHCTTICSEYNTNSVSIKF